MSIPDYQSLMLPILKLAGDKQEHSLRETIDIIADDYALTDEERLKLLPSGQQPVFDNRVGWARTYLKKAGLLQSTRRGYVHITDRGLKVLSESPSFINNKYLKKFPEFIDFQTKKPDDSINEQQKTYTSDTTPKELIEDGYQQIRENLAQDLLVSIKSNSPKFFERLVVELLVKMGYGGSIKDAGQAIGKTADEGIDGIIKEDRLGLDVIYIQAKRWDNSVGRDEIQKFVGALEGKRAKKGVFITTSEFSTGATEYAQQINAKVILIDKEKLAQFMIDFDVGVSREMVYEIKRIDTDYFEEQ